MGLARKGLVRIVMLMLLAAPFAAAWAAGDLGTKFTNRDSIRNTRHNMTQGSMAVSMDPYRNNYGEICVYCHTPHGANDTVAIPLWNRTVKATTYTTYNELGTTTLTQTVRQPGPSSIACLTCHDGQVAIDSVINMPGSGGYNKDQQIQQSNAFLDKWNPAEAPGHMSLTTGNEGCLACHASNAGALGARATDFSMFVIGTDLRNDHPVGVTYPPATNTDFKRPTATRTGVSWFDSDGDKTPDTTEVRLYDSGEGYMVECASCHDPHGVPTAGRGSQFTPTFLRVANTGSQLCLTCHTK
jgi:mono/diheme cytochrome c family protein